MQVSSLFTRDCFGPAAGSSVITSFWPTRQLGPVLALCNSVLQLSGVQGPTSSSFIQGTAGQRNQRRGLEHDSVSSIRADSQTSKHSSETGHSPGEIPQHCSSECMSNVSSNHQRAVEYWPLTTSLPVYASVQCFEHQIAQACKFSSGPGGKLVIQIERETGMLSLACMRPACCLEDVEARPDLG